MPETEQKRYETESKMYVGKLSEQDTKAPKLGMLQCYNLKWDQESSKYIMLN